jgi:hypothetical protein
MVQAQRALERLAVRLKFMGCRNDYRDRNLRNPAPDAETEEETLAMTIDIASVQSALAAMRAGATTHSGRTRATHGSADAVKLDAIPASPPPEVLDAVGVAAGAQDRLAQIGQALHFKLDDASGKLTVEVRDLHGNVLSTVPAGKALDIAAGGSID